MLQCLNSKKKNQKDWNIFVQKKLKVLTWNTSKMLLLKWECHLQGPNQTSKAPMLNIWNQNFFEKLISIAKIKFLLNRRRLIFFERFLRCLWHTNSSKLPYLSLGQNLWQLQKKDCLFFGHSESFFSLCRKITHRVLWRLVFFICWNIILTS